MKVYFRPDEALVFGTRGLRGLVVEVDIFAGQVVAVHLLVVLPTRALGSAVGVRSDSSNPMVAVGPPDAEDGDPDLIGASRITDDIADVADDMFTRGFFGNG
ncbi:MAG: hypothetical protein K0B00_09085 [Rhodobacteraceae bacterium]|nr:hypothetical protein [Paracoccaceae bacterium]